MSLASKSSLSKELTNEIQRVLCIFECDTKKLKNLLSDFVGTNQNPKDVSHREGNSIDPNILISVLSSTNIHQDPLLILLILKALKILSRHKVVRLQVDDNFVATIIKTIQKAPSSLVQAEGANVILNISYEKQNVNLVQQSNGIDCMTSLLKVQQADTQANAAGALQSICYQVEGRKECIKKSAVSLLVPLLHSDSIKVITRAAGAIHNISSDSQAIREIRKHNGIPRLVQLLQSPSNAVQGSAAGSVQNIAREVASRMLLQKLDAVEYLIQLLQSEDTLAQVCSAGALLNIMGTDLENGWDGQNQRKGFISILSQIMTLSILYKSLYNENLCSVKATKA